MQIRTLKDIAEYDALSIPDRENTYNNVLSSDDRKRMGKLRAFDGFVRAAELLVDRGSVICLDRPAPNIRCILGGTPYLFELGEVVDEGLARGYSHSLRTGEITGGAFDQIGPLQRMIKKKTKTYQTDGVPVDLVLYYWKHPPYDPAIRQTLTRLTGLIQQIFVAGLFCRIWIYEHPQGILHVLGKEQSAQKPWPEQKTILVVDVANSSAMNSQAGGLLATRRALGEFLARTRRFNDHNLGTFVKSTGDGAIAVFGDALSALNCATQLQRSLSENPIVVCGIPLEARIGIHAGLVNVSERSYGLDVFGPDVSLAARLTDLARPGQVAISEAARLALPEDRRDSLGPEETETIKGFSEPVAVSRIDFSGVLSR